MSLRVQFNSEYTAILGTAVYVFAYYEWAVIYLIQQFKPGFVALYCRREVPMTSGRVKQELRSVLNDPATVYAEVTREELQGCFDRFGVLIDKRNALIHAHPVTDRDGSQILNYQTCVGRPLPDMKWTIREIKEALREFDAAACDANEMLHRFG